MTFFPLRCDIHFNTLRDVGGYFRFIFTQSIVSGWQSGEFMWVCMHVPFRGISYGKHSIFKWCKHATSTCTLYGCVSACAHPNASVQTKIPLHININFEFPIFVACWYANHLKWLFSLRLNFNSRIDHRRVDYAVSILVQCDATLWHGYSIKTNYYYTPMYGIQPNNHAIHWNIWLNTSIYLIATI